MPARRSPQGIDIHPQKSAIIKALLEGESLTKISGWSFPKVSVTALHNYRNRVLRPTMRNAQALKDQLLTPDLVEQAEKIHAKRQKNAQQGAKQAQEDKNFQPEAAALAYQALMAVPILHIRDERIKMNQELTRRMLRVIDQRSADMSLCESCRRPADAHPWEEIKAVTNAKGDPIEFRIGCDRFVTVPGGDTGLIIRKPKGDHFEYAVDTGLLAEIREHEKHVAIEHGQWQESQPAGSVAIQIVVPSATRAAAGELPRITYDAAPPLALPSSADEEFEIGVVQK